MAKTVQVEAKDEVKVIQSMMMAVTNLSGQNAIQTRTSLAQQDTEHVKNPYGKCGGILQKIRTWARER